MPFLGLLLFCFFQKVTQRLFAKTHFFSFLGYRLLTPDVVLWIRGFLDLEATLTKFLALSGHNILLKFFNRLQKKGKLKNRKVFENFLMYVKWKFRVDPVSFLTERFFLQYDLPFYLEVVTFSNRNYLFPEPFRTFEASQKFYIKKFGSIMRKRSDLFYLNKVFTELLHFFNVNQQSYLRDSLESLIHQGLENRAYVHYRWLIRR